MATTPQNKPSISAQAPQVSAAQVAKNPPLKSVASTQSVPQQAPASPQPLQKPSAPQPQTSAVVAGQPKKPGNVFQKFDWLFVATCFIAFLHVLLLIWLENEKNEYNTLKKEHADRVYILQKASSVTQEDLIELEQAFLDEKNVVSFIQTLETSRPIFEEFTLAFTSDEPLGKDPRFLPFSITAVGSRETLTSFVEKLLGSTYVIEATTLLFETDKEDSTKLTLKFDGNLYIQNGK